MSIAVRSRIAVGCLLVATLVPVSTMATTLPATAAGTAPFGQTAVWHLPDAEGAMRIAGEAGTLTWPVYVPQRTAPGLQHFQLAYQAAIQVMPEASWITVTINGQTIGRTPVASPNGIKLVVFDVPPGTVQPGWNAVGIAVAQNHRVDCTLASTYELWTQINPRLTGFSGAPPAVTGLDDLPALPAGPDGGTALHLLLPKDPSPEDLGRAVRLVERVALRGHYPHPVVDTGPGTSGLQIAVGTAATLAALPVTAGMPAPRGVSLGTTHDGAPLLVASGATEDEIDKAIDEFGRSSPDPIGTEEGLAALARQGGRRLQPGSVLTFADLGIRSRTFAGRLFRQSFDVVLPPDAYPADYGEAQLALDGGYAPGLTADARFTVRVNGVLDGNLDFGDPRGVVLQRRVIHMPLDPFHPGHNRIEIEAQLPSRADASCDTLNAINAKERFLLLGTSTLSLPPLARVAQFPNLSSSLAGNMRVTPRSTPRLYMAKTTDGVVSAVATLLTNASRDTGTPADAVLQRGTPQPGADAAIVVGASSDVPAPLLASAGIDVAAVSSAWRAGALRGSIAAGGPDGQDGSDVARLDAWGQRVDDDPWLGSFGAGLRAAGSKFTGSLRAAGLLGYRDQAVTVTGDTSFVFAQGMAGDTPLTLVTARDDAALAAGAAAITEPSRLAGLDGRAASFSDGDAGATLVPVGDVTFFRTQDFSITNDRLVAAGWVSKHAAWYIGAVLLAVMLLGMSTAAFLARGRREQAP